MNAVIIEERQTAYWNAAGFGAYLRSSDKLIFLNVLLAE
jgi:hypothetical protein